MVNGYSLSGGSPNILQALIRSVVVIVAAIAGFFVFAASAAFALIVTGGLVILGFVVFIGMWLRAKVLGKPMNPYVKMYRAQTQRATRSGPRDIDGSGPVLDAHETPDGWSVDND
ncbi:MAG: hypothetical protein EX271_04610 [Acidimicrobiales bacterium]|nr:hypothetical protein [Hyphomonadaceae bacterium]RZV43064.1 MAG: hypothetical protein EX271_04610 [Acidimicrobiales bacterium]